MAIKGEKSGFDWDAIRGQKVQKYNEKSNFWDYSLYLGIYYIESFYFIRIFLECRFANPYTIRRDSLLKHSTLVQELSLGLVSCF